MMTPEKINRINQLAARAKSPRGLTPEELAERDALRREYVAAVRESLSGHLDRAVVQTPDGKRRPLKRKC